MPEAEFFYFAIPAVIVLGLAKGGFTGLGALGLPLFALGVNPIRAAAVLLPILIIQDAVSIIAYRRTWDGGVLRNMMPGAVAGVALGWWFAASVSVGLVLAVVGAIAILFGLYRLWRDHWASGKGGAAWPHWSLSLIHI